MFLFLWTKNFFPCRDKNCFCCLVTKLCQTLVIPWTMSQVPLSMDFPGKNTGVNCHFLLQEIFPTQDWTFFIFIFLNFFICSGFCHTLKWNSHGFTCVPHPDPPSHLPLHPLPLGFPSAPGPSACLQENSIETCILSRVKQITSPSWMQGLNFCLLHCRWILYCWATVEIIENYIKISNCHIEYSWLSVLEFVWNAKWREKRPSSKQL